MIFQAKLGSYADKTARVTQLAELIGSRIGAGRRFSPSRGTGKSRLDDGHGG